MCLRRKRKPRQYMEFLILNWDRVDDRNPMAVPNLEEALAGAGAIPVGASGSTQGVIYRVEVMRDDLTLQELLEIFEKLGFEVEQTT